MSVRLINIRLLGMRYKGKVSLNLAVRFPTLHNQKSTANHSKRKLGLGQSLSAENTTGSIIGTQEIG